MIESAFFELVEATENARKQSEWLDFVTNETFFEKAFIFLFDIFFGGK